MTMKLRRLSESVRGSVCNLLRLCTAVFLSTGASLAQAPVPEMGGRLGQATFVSPNFVLNLDVQVRGPDGAPLKSAAVVTLHAASGLPISTATTKRAQALFTQLAPGQYYIEVEASGYWKTREDTIIDPAITDNVVKVSLLPAAAGSEQAIYYHTPLLAPDVQKELEKGVAALKGNRVDQARKSLSAVLKKSPNHPAALYVMGISSEKKGNIAEARQYWEKSLLFDPTQEVAVYALGQSYLNENNYAKADELGRRLLQLAPNSWKAHALVASAAFRQGKYGEAVAQAERAWELGREGAGSISIVLAQALAVQDRRGEAIEALQRYLATKPDDSRAGTAQRLLSEIESKADRFVIAGSEFEKAAGEVPQPELTPMAEHWIPPDVDSAVFPTEPGAACDLPEVLAKAGEQLQLLPEHLDRFSATETVEHQIVRENGIASNAVSVSFAYVVSIHETRHGSLNVEEYRNGVESESVFPEHFATRGLPSQVFVFHPYYRDEFDMKCEGLARTGKGFAWQVRFEQKKSLPSRMQAHYLNGRRYPVPLKGRAWIDAQNYQVVHLLTDLREPVKAAGIVAQHTDISYGPVWFQKDKKQLWLPLSAEYYVQTKGHRIHRVHSFHDYLLFAVEDKQTIGTPKQGEPPQ
jgi:tetratricopeptide (TPR) repeat protein